MRTRTHVAVALAVVLGACSSGGGSGSTKSFKGSVQTYNDTSAQLVAHLQLMQDRALQGVTGLNSRTKDGYAAFDAYGETVSTDLAKAEALSQALYSSAQQLHAINAPSSTKQGPSLAKVQQPLGVLETLAILAAAGAFIKWVKDTNSEVKQNMADHQTAVDRFVANRTQYWINQGHPQSEAAQFAQMDASSVRIHEGLGAAADVGKTLVTQTGKQVGEAVLGAAIPGASTVMDFKNAAETGTLLGESLCPKPEGMQTKSFEGSCRLYAGATTNGTFTDVPTGTWNFAGTSGEYAPNGMGDQVIVEGGSTSMDDWESADEACGDNCDGTGGSGVGGSGGGVSGSCDGFVSAMLAYSEGNPVSDACQSCLNTSCGGECSTCMASSCVDTYAPCYNACDTSHTACYEGCDCSADCSSCMSYCSATWDACEAQCDATSSGQLVNAVGTCIENHCAAPCEF